MRGFERKDLTHPTGTMACWRRPGNAGKPVLILSHGNGLTALCQIELMELLSKDFDVHGLDLRGHGATHLPLPEVPINPWGHHENDLEYVIETYCGGKALFAGHSLSSVVGLRLARRRPELFERLICIDPAILSKGLRRVLRVARRVEPLMQRVQIYRGALKRREHWPDRQTAIDYFIGRKALATWPVTAVKAYVDSGLVPAEDGGLTLACPRNWEARTYKFAAAEIAKFIHTLTCPTLILRASMGNVFQRDLKLSPTTEMIDVKGGHFVHLEQPKLIAEHIREFSNS